MPKTKGKKKRKIRIFFTVLFLSSGLERRSSVIEIEKTLSMFLIVPTT